MGNLEERKGGTLWEKEGTLRIPCGHLVGIFPQGSGLLSQGTEGSDEDLVANLENTYQGKRKNEPLPPGWERLLMSLHASFLARGYGPDTVEYRLSAFRRFCHRLSFEGRPASSACPSDLPAHGRYLLACGSLGGESLAQATVSKHLSLVSRSLAILREDGVLVYPAEAAPFRTVRRHVPLGLGHGSAVLLASFADYLRTLGMAQSCVCSYPRNVRRFLAWLSDTGVCDVREVDERMLVAYRMGPGRLAYDGGEVSARTRIARECALRKFFAFLHRTRRIHSDPSVHMEYTRAPSSLPRAMPEASEMESVLSDIDAGTPEGVRDLAVLELLYGTGLRSSELRGLMLTDVQMEGQVLLVHGKGGKDALVPFGAKAAKALDLYLAFGRPVLARRGRGGDCGLLFLSVRGTRITPNGIGNLVRRRTTACAVHVVPHGLRHACATHMLRNGADLRMVQQLLRHESINTTLVYTRMLTSDVREAQRKYHPRECE